MQKHLSYSIIQLYIYNVCRRTPLTRFKTLCSKNAIAQGSSASLRMLLMKEFARSCMQREFHPVPEKFGDEIERVTPHFFQV
jgi:hypothetical protein